MKELREVVQRIALEALAACSPEKAVRRHVGVANEMAQLLGETVKGPVFVLAVGKAATKMAREARERLEGCFLGGLVVTREQPGSNVSGMELLTGGHPLPDLSSIKAARRALALIDDLPARATVLCLLSGGGSALFELPRDGVSLQDLAKVNESLLASGAPIEEINVVRKHLSRVKGGQLLARILPRRCVTLAVSDVVGDRIDVIASGPTVADSSTFADALNVIRRYALVGKMPENVLQLLQRGVEGAEPETLKEMPAKARAAVILGNEELCREVSLCAEREGFAPSLLEDSGIGEARLTGIRCGELAQAVVEEKATEPRAFIGGGEVVVTLGADAGSGGPNQEVALSCACRIREMEGVAFLSMDTDGFDGPTDGAGGVVDGSTWAKIRAAGIDPEDALARHDAYRALQAGGALLRTGSTGSNLNDLRILLVKGAPDDVPAQAKKELQRGRRGPDE